MKLIFALREYSKSLMSQYICISYCELISTQLCFVFKLDLTLMNCMFSKNL